jgi:hypothetical protein
MTQVEADNVPRLTIFNLLSIAKEYETSYFGRLEKLFQATSTSCCRAPTERR